MLDTRLLLDSDDISDVENMLDDAGIDYDWDGNNRLMISNFDLVEVTEILDELNIDFDEV